MPKSTKNKTPVQTKSHKLRTFFAAIAGIAAVYLIFASLTVIWLNQTLTNNSTYASTVDPLIEKPAIQNFIAENVTNQIIKNAPPQNLVAALLPSSDLNGALPQSQIDSLLKPVIQSQVVQIVSSPAFASIWANTNQTAHAQLISQLNSNANQLELNLNPAVTAVIDQLKTTKLSPLVGQINISPNSGVLDIKNSGVKKVHRYYSLFKEGTVAIVLVTLIAIALSVWLSVHHGKTARRILMVTGILALLQALILEAPEVIKTNGTNQVTQDAIRAFAEAIFHNLQLASLLLGLVFILSSVGSKLYVKHHH